MGDFKGNTDVTGQTTFKEDVAFEEDVLMGESLKMATGHIVSADGQNRPWFLRQQDVQNGDGGQAPTGLAVVEPAQSGYKQLRTYESADGGYAHYGGEDNRIVTYHTASDIIDEGVNEEGLIAKSAGGGITARGLEPQDFHTSDLLQEPGVLKSVAANDRYELRVQKVSLDEIDTTEGVADGDIIRYNSGTGQLQFETFPSSSGGGLPVFTNWLWNKGDLGDQPSNGAPPVGDSQVFFGDPKDVYLGGIPANHSASVQSQIIDNPRASLECTGGGDYTTGAWSGSYRIVNTVDYNASDRYLMNIRFVCNGPDRGFFIEVQDAANNVLNTAIERYTGTVGYGYNHLYTTEVSAILPANSMFYVKARPIYQNSPNSENARLLVFSVTTTITKVA